MQQPATLYFEDLELGDEIGPLERWVTGEMVEAFSKAGALAAGMSGSGSSVFGVFPEPATRAAIRRLQRPDWLVQLGRTLTRREAGRRVGL